MADNFQEKTEQPTEKRLEDARKRGQIAQSRDLPSCLTILFASIFLYFVTSHGFREMFRVYVTYVTNAEMEVNMANIYEILSFGIYRWFWIVMPIFGLLAAVAIFGNVFQTGFNWSMEAIQFKGQNLNPLSGIKKLLSKRSAVEVLKSTLKITILSYVAYALIAGELPVILALPGKDSSLIVEYLGATCFRLALKVGVIFLFVAVLDFFFQKWQHKKDLMMTQHEVKEESKEREGSPLIKSRMRSIQKEMARRRMIEDVKTADVIVTNPTHFAVGIKYEAGSMPAPRVVARGAGFVAERIKEKARAYGVPLTENKPLAQALYHSVKVGDYIPEKFYVIVAELLAAIYKQKGRARL